MTKPSHFHADKNLLHLLFPQPFPSSTVRFLPLAHIAITFPWFTFFFELSAFRALLIYLLILSPSKEYELNHQGQGPLLSGPKNTPVPYISA